MPYTRVHYNPVDDNSPHITGLFGHSAQSLHSPPKPRSRTFFVWHIRRRASAAARGREGALQNYHLALSRLFWAGHRLVVHSVIPLLLRVVPHV